MNTQTYYFDTGVTRNNGSPGNPITLFGDQVWRGGTKQIPFQCNDVPEGAAFMFACDYPDLPESRLDNVVVTDILPGSGLLSKYAYWRTCP